MRVELSRFIENDLDAIAEWIAQESPARAVSFLREIGEEFARISRRPFQYQLRAEIGDDARLAIVGHNVILFRVAGDAVKIERVVYGGRNLTAQFHRS